MKQTLEERKAELRNLRTPRLDAFRDEVRSMITSDMLGYMTHQDKLIEHLEVFKELKKPEISDLLMAAIAPDRYPGFREAENIVSAALLALCDEWDRRVPVPKS